MFTKEQLMDKSKEELILIIMDLYATIDCMEDAHTAEVNGAYETGGRTGYNDGYSAAEDQYRW